MRAAVHISAHTKYRFSQKNSRPLKAAVVYCSLFRQCAWRRLRLAQRNPKWNWVYTFDGLEALPELAHRVSDENDSCATVDQIVCFLAEVPQERVGRPQGLVLTLVAV